MKQLASYFQVNKIDKPLARDINTERKSPNE